MKLSHSRIIALAAVIIIFVVIALLFITAPKNPQAVLRVVDVSGKPIAGAVIQPNGLRVKTGPYSGGWYGWSEERQHVPTPPVTTDKDGFAIIPYPFYVIEKLETGTLCFAIEHPDYVAQSPERVVATALPHGAPWRSRLQDLFDRIRHHAIETRPDPIILQKGAILCITVTNEVAPIYWTRIFYDYSRGPLIFKIHRGLITQGAVEPLWVIEGFDVIEDGQFGLGVGLELSMVKPFGFQSAPEGFHGGVVVAVAG